MKFKSCDLGKNKISTKVFLLEGKFRGSFESWVHELRGWREVVRDEGGKGGGGKGAQRSGFKAASVKAL